MTTVLSRSSNWTAVPGCRPNRFRTSAGTVTWPLEEILLFIHELCYLLPSNSRRLGLPSLVLTRRRR